MVGSKRKANDSTSSSTSSENNWVAASTSSAKTRKPSPKKSTKIDEYGDVNHSNDDNHYEEVVLKRGETADYNRLWEFVHAIKNATDQNPEIKKKKCNCNFTTLLTSDQRADWPDFDAMSASFRTYYTRAVALSKVNICFAVNRLIDFMQEETFVTLHPEFPKGSSTAHSIMCRKLGLGIGVGAQELRSRDPSDTLSSQAAKEAEADKSRYYNDLAAFLEKHREQLLPAHICYVEKRINNYSKEKKKQAGGESGGTPKKSKSTRAKLTAFDYYKQSKKHKYLEMSAEDREAKLKRHFDKLDEEMRNVFEDLASNL